ncbi:MAG TPA: DoxX family protein [Gemmatimonadales bacterium]|nr:DoxX family protein [Gemmatimonadales bacterium]
MSAVLTPSAPSLDPATVPGVSRRARLAGRVLSGIAVLFLAVDTLGKLARPAAVIAGSAELGFAAHHVPILGVIEVVCLLLYLVPRTAPLGAVLWTGYLGGAIATHLRLDNPLFTHLLFPIYVAAFLWGGLYLRDLRVRALLAPAR